MNQFFSLSVLTVNAFYVTRSVVYSTLMMTFSQYQKMQRSELILLATNGLIVTILTINFLCLH